MIFGREPALILGALQAIIALAIGFGLKLTGDQVALILAASAAVIALITRQVSTPTAAPVLPTGTAVTTPSGGSAVVTKASPNQ